jgi:hypothetical protein
MNCYRKVIEVINFLKITSREPYPIEKVFIANLVQKHLKMYYVNVRINNLLILLIDV